MLQKIHDPFLGWQPCWMPQCIYPLTNERREQQNMQGPLTNESVRGSTISEATQYFWFFHTMHQVLENGKKVSFYEICCIGFIREVSPSFSLHNLSLLLLNVKFGVYIFYLINITFCPNTSLLLFSCFADLKISQK